MSIYEALGHRIHVLERRKEEAKETISQLVTKLETLSKDNPDASHAEVAELARKALGAVAGQR